MPTARNATAHRQGMDIKAETLDTPPEAPEDMEAGTRTETAIKAGMAADTVDSDGA